MENKKCSCSGCSTNTGYRITTNTIPGACTNPDCTPITNPDYTPKTVSPQPPEIKGNPLVPFFTIDDGAWYIVVTAIKCRDCNAEENTTHYIRKDFEGTLTHICPKCHSHRVEEISRQYYPRITGGCTGSGSHSVEMEWPDIAKDIVVVELECELCRERSKHNIEVDKSSAAASDGRMYTYTCSKCGRLNHEIIRNSPPHITPRLKKQAVEVSVKFEQTDTSYTYTCKECDQKFKFPDRIHLCPYCGGRVMLDGINMTFNLSTR